MARLIETTGGREWWIEAESVLGRSPRCSLRLAKHYVSAQHASLRWTGNAWELRDLGSRNGTWLDGKRLVPGESSAVVEGSKIALGHPDEEWTCTQAGPPQVLLVSLTTGKPLVGEHGLLGVPSAEDPLATVFRGANGQWLLETNDGESSVLENGATVEIAQQAWRFSGPEAPLPTVTAAGASDPEPPTLHFLASGDEEYVELRLEYETKTTNLGCRAHNHLLLTLARARLEDAAQGLPPTACGWIYKEDLVAGHESPQRIDLEVFRLRGHFARSAPEIAAAIIERRSRTRQLRIGFDGIRITTI